ncbi:hypothetical protein D3C87_1921080 [compost metagenome]
MTVSMPGNAAMRATSATPSALSIMTVTLSAASARSTSAIGGTGRKPVTAMGLGMDRWPVGAKRTRSTTDRAVLVESTCGMITP